MSTEKNINQMSNWQSPIKGCYYDLKYESKWYFANKTSDVYVIDLAENNLSPYRNEFNKLMGEVVMIDKRQFVVVGIEAYCTGMNYQHKTIGLMVKPLNEKINQ